MTAPKVSVVVTCFNLGAYLDEAVQSVLDQSFQNFEIVIVDDGSTDAFTQRLLSDYRRPRTRTFRTENRGLSAARNTGAATTTGEYLCMLDADDLLEPTMLEKSVAVLDRDSAIAFVSHWVHTFGEEEGDWTPTRCDLATLLDINTLNGAAVVRRTAFEAVKGFDESMRDGCEDWDFWISLVERGFEGHILPEVLFRYRRRANSMSRVMMEGDRHPFIYSRLVEKHAQAYGDKLDALVVRRDKERAHLDLHLNDLSIEFERITRPALMQAREDLAVLEAQRASAEAIQEQERTLAASQAAASEWERLADAAENRVDELRAELAERSAALTESVAERDKLLVKLRGSELAIANLTQAHRDVEAEASRLTTETAALRKSWSWRLTAPLRAIYEFAARAGRRAG